MVKVLILYYSTYTHIHQMAKAAAEGAKEVHGAEVTLRRVPETLPDGVLVKMHALEAKQAMDKEVPVLTDPNELAHYDVIIFGTPTRYGNMAGQMKSFLDSTGQLWAKGALVGKVGAVFSSTATQHGGQETTITSFHSVLLHHGFVIVGLPYSFAGQSGVDQLRGGSPYGATTIAGSDGSRQPSAIDLDGARFQARHATQIGANLLAGAHANAAKK